MYHVSDIRPVISKIPNCMYDLPPEETHRGQTPAVSTAWNPADQSTREFSLDPGISDAAMEDGEFSLEEIFEVPPHVDLDRAVSALDGEEGRKIHRAVQEKSVDALAWYLPFHAHNVQWGIYVPASSLIYMANGPLNQLSCPVEVKVLLALRALHQHELFHFAVDYFCSQLECLTGLPCHKPGRALKDLNLGYNLLEEGLANAQMIRSFWRVPRSIDVPGKTDRLRHFVRKSPPGYRDGFELTALTRFRTHTQELAQAYASHVPVSDEIYTEGVDLVSLFPQWPIPPWRYCPVHISQDGQRLNIDESILLWFRQVDGPIHESSAFQRELVRMPASIQRKWSATRQRLAVSVQGAGLNFKLWRRDATGPIYSLRLPRGYRAHLQYDRASTQWSAIKIGTHKSMGHG